MEEKFTLEKVSLLINYDLQNKIKNIFIIQLKIFCQGRRGSGACVEGDIQQSLTSGY